jgi:outer membrane protein
MKGGGLKLLQVLILVLVALAGSLAWAAPRAISLDEAHRLAIQNNPNVGLIAGTVERAEILRWRAWALLLPNLSANGSITRSDQEITFGMPDFEALITGAVTEAMGGVAPAPGPGDEMVIQELWGKQFGFTANIALFNPQALPLLRNAYDNIKASRIQGEVGRNDLLFAVTAAFYGLRSSQAARGISAKTLETAREFLRLAEVSRAVGNAVKVDVLRAAIAVTEAEKAVLDAEDSVHLARTALATLLGVQGELEITPPPAPEAVAEELDAAVSHALDKRRDLEALDLQARMVARDKDHTWTQFIPTLDMTWNWTWNSAAGFADDHDSWRLIFGARWNIFNGGQRIAELKEKDVSIRMAGLRRAQLEMSIREDVEKRVVELERCQRNRRMVEKQQALAVENHRLVSRQYEEGLSTGLELLDATNTLSRVRRALVLEELRCDLAVLSLNRTAGEVLDAARDDRPVPELPF